MATADSINADWDARDQSFGATLRALEDLGTDVSALIDTLQSTDVPFALGARNREVVATVGGMASSTEQMVAGLKAPDDGSKRRQALTEFKAKAAASMDAIESTQADIEQALSTPPTTTSVATTTVPPTPAAPTTATPVAESATDSSLAPAAADPPVNEGGGLPIGLWIALLGGGGFILGRVTAKRT